MYTAEIASSLGTLFAELVHGAPSTGAYVLNPGDAGLLNSLGRLSAREASARNGGGASIAAHVDHLRYGLTLLNRWAAGEHPFEDADWAESWRKTTVSEPEWADLQQRLRAEAEQWLTTLRTPRELPEPELNAVIGSIAHLAYHLGAMRQIDRVLRGPSADEPPA